MRSPLSTAKLSTVPSKTSLYIITSKIFPFLCPPKGGYHFNIISGLSQIENKFLSISNKFYCS